MPTKKKDGTYGPLLDIEGEFIGLVDSKLDEMSEKAYEIIEAIKKNNEKGAEYIRTLFDAYSDNANLSEFSSRDKVANNIMDYLKLKDQAVYKATKCTPSDDLETVIEKIEATIDKDDKVHNKVYSLFFYGIASEISLYTNNICKEKAIKVKKS